MLLESLLLLNTPTWFKTFLEDQALPALGALCNNDLSSRALQDRTDRNGPMLKLCAQYARRHREQAVACGFGACQCGLAPTHMLGVLRCLELPDSRMSLRNPNVFTALYLQFKCPLVETSD